ncbi:MAG TPA: hypothetical protein VIM64_08035 [Puia sp.]
MLRRTICCSVLFTVIFYSPPATAQFKFKPDNEPIHLDSIVNFKPIPISRWILSFNPYGLFEWPSAAGFGIGYRCSGHAELWSESSFLWNGPYKTQGPVTGFKQVVQGKFFPYEKIPFFFALEARYKGYQYRDTSRFVNTATHDTLKKVSSFSHHYFWGAALQVGVRTALGSGQRFQLEFVCGLGIRKYVHTWYDVPKGYEYTPYRSIDLKINDIVDESPDVYLPGSLRLIWLFGKRLRP